MFDRYINIMNNQDIETNYWYINFNIKKFNFIDDVKQIINKIDEMMCVEEQIYSTYIMIKITRSEYTNNDYICKTNVMCDKKIIEEYLEFKFIQTVNLIKFYNDEFGFDWYITYTIE